VSGHPVASSASWELSTHRARCLLRRHYETSVSVIPVSTKREHSDVAIRLREAFKGVDHEVIFVDEISRSLG
jgi:hypothetical protein